MDSAGAPPMGGGVSPPPDWPENVAIDDTSPGDESPSLMADVEALISDGKTYLQAELAYQKSRAGYAGNRLKWTAIYGAAAFGLLHLAGIALTVGAVIALTSLLGPWIATLLVVAVLLLAALFFVLRLRGKFNDIRDVFADDKS